MDKQSQIVPQRNHLGINSVSIFILFLFDLAFFSQNSGTSIALNCTWRGIYDNRNINQKGTRQ